MHRSRILICMLLVLYGSINGHYHRVRVIEIGAGVLTWWTCHFSIKGGVRDADPCLLVGAICEQVEDKTATRDSISERYFDLEDFPKSEEGCKALE